MPSKMAKPESTRPQSKLTQPGIATRTPQPFPLDINQHDTNFDIVSYTNPLPPMPDIQVVVNPDPEWKPRSLEVAIAEGKKRKREEFDDDVWDSEDELLCLRREQWRMMRTLGIETEEAEPCMCLSTYSSAFDLLNTFRIPNFQPLDGDLVKEHWYLTLY